MQLLTTFCKATLKTVALTLTVLIATNCGVGPADEPRELDARGELFDTSEPIPTDGLRSTSAAQGPALALYSNSLHQSFRVKPDGSIFDDWVGTREIGPQGLPKVWITFSFGSSVEQCGFSCTGANAASGVVRCRDHFGFPFAKTLRFATPVGPGNPSQECSIWGVDAKGVRHEATSRYACVAEPRPGYTHYGCFPSVD